MDAFDYAFLHDWNIEALTGYQPISTFYTDLGIAEFYGINSLKDSIKNIRESWSSDTKMFTEFIMAVNWKSWEHAETNVELSQYYADLYYELCDWVNENWNNEQLSYFYEITD